MTPLGRELEEILTDVQTDVLSLKDTIEPGTIGPELTHAALTIKDIFFESLYDSIQHGREPVRAVDSHIWATVITAMSLGFQLGREHHKRGYTL